MKQWQPLEVPKGGAKPKIFSAVQSSAGARYDKAKHPPVQKTTPTPVALPRQ